jgi:hypothetical protein
MTRWKVPDYIRRMRDESKPGSAPLKPWYRSLFTAMAHLGWSALQRVFAAVRKLLIGVWVWLRRPWWPRVTYIVKSASAWILAFAGLYTLFSSFVSMSIGDPLDPDRLFTAPITITNTSTLFTLVDVEQSCFTNQIRYANPRGVQEGNNFEAGYIARIPELLRGNQDTVVCFHSIGSKFTIAGADVTMQVSYKLAVYFYRWRVTVPLVSKHTEARFITYKLSDGKFKWLPYGLKDPDPKSFWR